LQLLRQKGFGYLVNESRRQRSRYREYFQDESQFKAIGGRAGKPAVQVRLLADPFAEKESESEGKPPDQLVLCKSQGRLEKEQAIYSQAEAKYVAGLQRLSQRIAQGKLKQPEKIQRALGRLQGKHPRVQRLYTVSVGETKTEEASLVSTRTLEWHRQEAAYQAREELFGCYVLRTERQNLGAEELWHLYMTLSQAEDGFKALKGDLGLRPNYHQLEGRVEGHVFISVLAYQLLRYLLRRLEEQDDHRSWNTIKAILSTHCYTTILLPTKAGTLYRIRKAGEPEEAQKDIYGKLKLEWKHLPNTKTIVMDKGATTL
jgi:hypothetical protein